MVVGPYANELQVPLLSWCGTERFWGDYCFRLGNGDCGGDAALVVGWLKRQGHERVAVLSEVSPNGEEYFRYFRQECRRRGISDRRGRDREPDAGATSPPTSTTCAPSVPTRSRTWGTACSPRRELLREALDDLAWDPPRIMGTAFMFYLMGFDKFEGWVGIDQLCPDNRLVEPFHERYVARYGADPPMWPNAIPVLAYDTARVLVEALYRAPVLTGWGVKAGFEQIRFMPSADRRTADPHRRRALRPPAVQGRLAALRPRPRRRARVRGAVRAVGVKPGERRWSSSTRTSGRRPTTRTRSTASCATTRPCTATRSSASGRCSRHADVAAAHNDPSLFVSSGGVTIEGYEKDSPFLIVKDPPEHTWHRKIVGRVFTPRRIADLEPFIRQPLRRAPRRVPRCAPEFDVVTDFSVQLPLDVISELLGIPEELPRDDPRDEQPRREPREPRRPRGGRGGRARRTSS